MKQHPLLRTTPMTMRDFPNPLSSKPAAAEPDGTKQHEQQQQQHEEQQDGEMFGVILRRSRSVSFANSTLTLRAEKDKNSVLENAVKRAFSLRRSSSVCSSSRGYYKIFHHCHPVSSVSDNQSEMQKNVPRKARRKRPNVFEACRRIIHRVLA